MTASLRVGGVHAGVDSSGDRLLGELGSRLGLMFQIGDDLLDVEGDSVTLGKTAGKDEGARKLTFPSLHGVEGSRRLLGDVRAESLDLVSQLPSRRRVFASLVDYLCDRDR